MAIVVFDYAGWAALYPQFDTTVTAPQAQGCFDTATLFCANTDCAIVPYEPNFTPPILVRLKILNLLTAHIAAMQYGAVIGGALVVASPLVGRVSSATQGSVSIDTEMRGPELAAWYNQTQWGATAWQAMAPFRTAQYRASPGRYAFVGAPVPFYLGRRPWP